MARATLENVFAPRALDTLFHEVAQQQYERELLFSTLVDLMSLVVCRVQPSIHAAYQQRRDAVPVSLRAVYDKLQHIEPQTSRRLVQHTAAQATALLQQLRGACTPPLPGFQVKILDGNHLQGTQHRLKELRTLGGGALPGLCLAVLDPQWGTICDVIPCEDAHTQECQLLEGILERVQPSDVWIDDRHFCTSDFLFGLIERHAYFVTRQHAGHLRCELLGKRRCRGRTETGVAYEQRMRISHPRTGATHVIRRITVALDTPTRDGETELNILTNLPAEAVDAAGVAELYRRRWSLETAFQEMTVYLRCELNTLGYPAAALFGFCTAAACYNLFAILRGALRGVHGEEMVSQEVSTYFLMEELSGTYRGMMIALPAESWESLQTLSVRELARLLRTWTAGIDLSRYRKHPRGPKTRQVRPSAPRGHTATARLLDGRKNKHSEPQKRQCVTRTK
jgi:IS4 transposase